MNIGTLTPRAHGSGALAILAAVALCAGCASRPKIEAKWPPPPDKARIEYVRAFRTGDDLDPGFGRRFLNALFPRDPGAVVVSPSGLALSPDEKRLYIATGGRARIVVVDRESRKMGAFPASGAKTTIAVGVDAQENVYVADRLGNAVFVYDRGGGLLRKFGMEVLDGPTALAVDPRGQQVYVVSAAASGKGNHRIEVFSLAGKHLRTMGKRGDGPGEFNFPTSLFVAPDRNLYVSDMLNFRVQVFDPDGQMVGSFGQLGNGMVGAFDKIKGVAFDSFGNVYVVDSMQGVHILNASHQPLMLFGGPPFMATPGPIVIDSKNRIFVSDFSANVVHEFQLVNTTAADSYEGGKRPMIAPPAPAASPSRGRL
jgi:DNA-binding beta-propeller fold protein YncE